MSRVNSSGCGAVNDVAGRPTGNCYNRLRRVVLGPIRYAYPASRGLRHSARRASGDLVARIPVLVDHLSGYTAMRGHFDAVGSSPGSDGLRVNWVRNLDTRAV